MIITGKCKKCGIRTAFDVGEVSREEGINILKKAQIGECPGFHVEIGTYNDYYNFGPDFKTVKEAKQYNKEQKELDKLEEVCAS